MKSGIYRIHNVINHKNYIGQSRNVHRRIREHLRLLSRGEHHSSKLQKDYDRFGIGAFRFEVLEYCEPHLLTKKEAEYIKKFDAIRNGYNIQVVIYEPVVPVQKVEREKENIVVQNVQVQGTIVQQQIQESKEVQVQKQETKKVIEEDLRKERVEKASLRRIAFIIVGIFLTLYCFVVAIDALLVNPSTILSYYLLMNAICMTFTTLYLGRNIKRQLFKLILVSTFGSLFSLIMLAIGIYLSLKYGSTDLGAITFLLMACVYLLYILTNIKHYKEKKVEVVEVDALDKILDWLYQIDDKISQFFDSIQKRINEQVNKLLSVIRNLLIKLLVKLLVKLLEFLKRKQSF